MSWFRFAPRAKKVVVFTAVTGTRTGLRDDQDGAGAMFVAYVDRNWSSKVWEQRRACELFRSNRRNARIHKILAHEYIDADYSIWMDGNVAIRVPAPQLIREWLDGCDMAAFTHHRRACTYTEAAACRTRELDSASIIDAQVARYRQRCLETDQGLAETTVLLRRHTRQIEEFNNYWWAQVCRYSVRDQISFIFSARQVGIRYRLIGPPKLEHPYFHIIKNRAQPEVV